MEKKETYIILDHARFYLELARKLQIEGLEKEKINSLRKISHNLIQLFDEFFYEGDKNEKPKHH